MCQHRFATALGQGEVASEVKTDYLGLAEKIKKKPDYRAPRAKNDLGSYSYQVLDYCNSSILIPLHIGNDAIDQQNEIVRSSEGVKKKPGAKLGSLKDTNDFLEEVRQEANKETKGQNYGKLVNAYNALKALREVTAKSVGTDLAASLVTAQGLVFQIGKSTVPQSTLIPSLSKKDQARVDKLNARLDKLDHNNDVGLNTKLVKALEELGEQVARVEDYFKYYFRGEAALSHSQIEMLAEKITAYTATVVNSDMSAIDLSETQQAGVDKQKMNDLIALSDWLYDVAQIRKEINIINNKAAYTAQLEAAEGKDEEATHAIAVLECELECIKMTDLMAEMALMGRHDGLESARQFSRLGYAVLAIVSGGTAAGLAGITALAIQTNLAATISTAIAQDQPMLVAQHIVQMCNTALPELLIGIAVVAALGGGALFIGSLFDASAISENIESIGNTETFQKGLNSIVDKVEQFHGQAQADRQL